MAGKSLESMGLDVREGTRVDFEERRLPCGYEIDFAIATLGLFLEVDGCCLV